MEILNYQGNKHKLLSFIDGHIKTFLSKDKALLDIFCGGCSVTNHFSKKYPIIANDLEPYSSIIAKAILLKNQKKAFDDAFYANFLDSYSLHLNKICTQLSSLINLERELLSAKSDDYVQFSKTVPTFWNGGYSPLTKNRIDAASFENIENSFILFTCFYSNNYFGLFQAAQIDSLRFAIQNADRSYNIDFLFLCLFGAMNKCVFSKDGHMAQPLNIEKNFKRAILVRNKDIFDEFMLIYNEYNSLLVFDNKINQVFNENFVELLNHLDSNKIGCIYADPPYTDMQYSRYYHLLNTACEYKIVGPTIKNGLYSSGLYLNNRRQSNISKKGTFASTFSLLLKYASSHSIPLVISFGYPTQESGEQHNRYLISIDDLVSMAKIYFGSENVKTIGVNYTHANQRKPVRKQVIEYLIICGGNTNGGK